MPTIRQLSPHVADLIAAGEVVERPASVVKELVENSIDAGATAVTVEIQHGGMSLIRVTDDGCGIAADQAETAFLRHATSKIATEYDLEAIGTLGFRGEALAAIAAVSRVELLTRARGAELGVSLTLEGGAVTGREEAGCPVGTTMVVRSLFFNTPARLKFMKKDAAEGAAVFAAVQRLALSHPEVSVRFLRDGRQELLTPGDGETAGALYSVLGRDLALGFLPVSGSGENGFKVEGFVSMPACCRGSRAYQHFFVNGRHVKSRALAAAVEEAYRNQKMVGRFPGCVLYLTTRLSGVDVNVHPAKTEVKFTNERQVFSAVYHSVLSALEGQRSHPAAALTPKAAAEPASPAVAPPPPEEADPAPEAAPLPLHDAARVETAPARSAVNPVNNTVYHVPLRRSPPAPAPRPAPAKPVRPAVRGIDITPPEEDLPPAPPWLTRQETPAVQTPPPEPEEVPAPAPREEIPAPVPEEPAPQVQETLLPQPEEPWVVRGELFRTYILVEQGEKVLLIDKHAAHERMQFDRMRQEDYVPMAQQLLTPAVFTPEPREREALLEALPLLEEFGFQVEELGPTALAVRQAPGELDTEQAPQVLSQLAQQLLTAGGADPAAARDALLHTMACKAAIKGGQRSGEEELEVVARAVLSGQVKYCPHGRPVAIELTRKQLERQFKR